jgi:hypothetical protein
MTLRELADYEAKLVHGPFIRGGQLTMEERMEDARYFVKKKLDELQYGHKYGWEVERAFEEYIDRECSDRYRWGMNDGRNNN